MPAPSLPRRIALRAGALSAVLAVAGLARPKSGLAARGDPLILGKVNLAGKRSTVLRSKAGPGGPPGFATLVIENRERNSQATGLFVNSYGGVCVNAYGQLGGTAISANSNDGRAIAATGRVSFDFAGSAVVKAGESSMRLKLATGMVNFPEGSLVLATLQGDAGPGVVVRHVIRLDPQPPDFEALEIVLTAATTQDVRVAYWVFYTAASGGVFVPA